MNAPVSVTLPAGRLEEIRARLEAATPGPWSVAWEDDGWVIVRHVPKWVRVATAHLYATDENDDARPNAAFIAHAPEDIAFLLARVAELETALIPFAKADALFDPTWPNERGINFIAARLDDDFPELTRGDLRRARAALKAVAP